MTEQVPHFSSDGRLVTLRKLDIQNVVALVGLGKLDWAEGLRSLGVPVVSAEANE